MREPGVGRIVDATDLACSPDATTIAFTAWRRLTATADPEPTIGVVTIASGHLDLLDDLTGTSNRRAPTWSPDGSGLLCLSTSSDGLQKPLLIDVGDRSTRTLIPQPLLGNVEGLAWSPSGTAIAILLAEPGAEISDVFGSGRVAGDNGLPDWCPEVSQEGRTGWRRIWLADVAAGSLEVLQSPFNVWEFCWAGNGHIAVVASDEPQEDAWYDAKLRLIDLATSNDRLLFGSDAQLAGPAADAEGRFISVISGSASDRGLVAGDLVVVDTHSRQQGIVRAGGVHVTSHAWSGEGRGILAGIRGPETVMVRHSGLGQDVHELWATTSDTFGPGTLLPVAVPCGDSAAAVVMESHARPPTVGVITDGEFVSLLDLGNAGAEIAAELCSDMRLVSWSSSDGLQIDGYLLTPAAPSGRPGPLVVFVHGGPVWRWRDISMDRLVQIPLLLAHGYAVLLPNPRGSVGHGEDFVRRLVGEIGGLDVDDVLSGVDMVVAQGVADRGRVGVIGASYGGFLAAWLATRPGMFAAAVAISPVTDWVSQHFTTNIPQSDVRFLRGHPLDPNSQYWHKSPLTASTSEACPLLLTAGAHDLATPPAQALEMHRALIEWGVESDVAIYPREGHDVHEWPAVLDHCTRMLLWFDRFLFPSGRES